MSKIFNFQLFFRKPRVIVVTGWGAVRAKEAILQVLKPKFRIGKDIQVLESGLKNEKEFEKLKLLIRKSSLFVFVLTHFGEIPSDGKDFTTDRETIKELAIFAKGLPVKTFFILNFDDETTRKIGDTINLKTCTFGFQEGADFRASDVKLNGGTNFKVNFKDNIVPIWIEGSSGKEQIYSALAAVCIGTIFDFNLVEVSQALKDYRGR